jgi:sensor c-di-GMP phosphodiesterase-like protein
MNLQSAVNYIGRHAKPLAVLGGAVMFFATSAVTIIILGSFVLDRAVLKQQSDTLAAQSITTDGRDLLQDLVRRNDTSCTPENLRQLKGLLLEHRFVRDIGLYDSDGRLYCTTGMNLLPTPLADGPTIYVSPNGLKTWFDVPLLLSEGKIKAAISRLGNFNIVIDPYVTNALLENPDAVIWFSNGELTPIGSNPNYSQERIERLRERVLRLGNGVHFSLMSAEVDLISAITPTPYIFHNNLTLADVVRNAPNASIAALALSILVALLTSSALVPRLMRFRSLRYKVRHLCNENHVRCMYQPIVELKTGKVVGCEVLMRLFDEYETYFPDKIMPLIVDHGLTWQLDRSVTSKALSELGHHMSGIVDTEFKVAFNFFPDDLNFDVVHQHLQASRTRYGAERFRINVEVTEHSFSGDVLKQIHRFKAAGYLVSVDDFGTGYSNLGSVYRTSPDFLKIDKSFVFDMEDTSVRSSLIPEIIAIARAVNAEIIAEGEENRAQAEKLLALGARYGQGYFFAKPMYIEDFVAHYLESTGLTPITGALHQSIQRFRMPGLKAATSVGVIELI